jgi:hypothetical protein
VQRLDLAKNETARLANAMRTRLDCVDGVAWITIDGDLRDIVLTRGQSFVVDRGEKVLVYGLQNGAVVDVQPAGQVLPFPDRRASRWLGGGSKAA